MTTAAARAEQPLPGGRSVHSVVLCSRWAGAGWLLRAWWAWACGAGSACVTDRCSHSLRVASLLLLCTMPCLLPADPYPSCNANIFFLDCSFRS